MTTAAVRVSRRQLTFLAILLAAMAAVLETPVAYTGFTLTGCSLYDHKEGQNQHL